MTCDNSRQLIFLWAGDSAGTLGLSRGCGQPACRPHLPSSPVPLQHSRQTGRFQGSRRTPLANASWLKRRLGSRAPGWPERQVHGKLMALALSLLLCVCLCLSLRSAGVPKRSDHAGVDTGWPWVHEPPAGKSRRAASGEWGHHGPCVGGADVAEPPLGRPSALPSCAVCFSTVALRNRAAIPRLTEDHGAQRGQVTCPTPPSP